jgi:uncharacterized protein YyaL (SSP411 family)
MQASPSSHTTLLTALEESLRPPRVVIVRGADDAITPWHAALSAQYRPDTLALAIATGVPGLPAVLNKPVATHDPAAWVCEGTQCLPPIADLSELDRTLSAESARAP